MGEGQSTIQPWDAHTLHAFDRANGLEGDSSTWNSPAMKTTADKKWRVTLSKPAAFGDTYQVFPTATGFHLTRVETSTPAASEDKIAAACRAANKLGKVEAENREWESFEAERRRGLRCRRHQAFFDSTFEGPLSVSGEDESSSRDETLK